MKIKRPEEFIPGKIYHIYGRYGDGSQQESWFAMYVKRNNHGMKMLVFLRCDTNSFVEYFPPFDSVFSFELLKDV